MKVSLANPVQPVLRRERSRHRSDTRASTTFGKRRAFLSPTDHRRLNEGNKHGSFKRPWSRRHICSGSRTAAASPPPPHGFPPGPTRKVKPLVTGLSRRRDCLPGTQVTLSAGTVEHSGFLSHAELFGLVEAKTDVTALRSIDREEKIHQVALSFQARTVGEAKIGCNCGGPALWGSSAGEVSGWSENSPLTRDVSRSRQAYRPGDTPYFLDSEATRSRIGPRQLYARSLLAGRRR